MNKNIFLIGTSLILIVAAITSYNFKQGNFENQTPVPPPANNVNIETAANLQGYFTLPILRQQDIVRRLGRGLVEKVIPINKELTIVIAGGGATLFNLATGQPVWEIDCPSAGGAVSPDGRLLALYAHNDIYLWDLTNGQLRAKLREHIKSITTANFSPDSKYLVSASEDRVILWDATSEDKLKELAKEPYSLSSINFSPNGKYLAFENSMVVELWDVVKGKKLHQLKGHEDAVWSVAFSPNGKYLASGGRDFTVRLWDLNIYGIGNWKKPVGEEIYRFNRNIPKLIYDITFSPDSKKLAFVGSDYIIKISDLTTNLDFSLRHGHEKPVPTLAFTPDGKYIVSGSYDRTVRLWDVASPNQLYQINQHTNSVISVAFSPDGQYLATASVDGKVQLWEVATGKLLRQINAHKYMVKSIAFSPDSKYLVSVGSNPDLKDPPLPGDSYEILRLWDVASGKELRQVTGYSGYIKSVAFSSDGKYLVSGVSDGKVILWDVVTGMEVKKLAVAENIGIWTKIDFSDDGKYFAVGSWGKVEIWDMASGKKLHQIIDNYSDSTNYRWSATVAFSPNGKYLVSGYKEKVQLWDVATGKQLQELAGNLKQILTVAFSPDSKYVAAGGWDKTVRLWDVASGGELQEFTGHSDRVSMLAFSPDGKHLASGSWDGTVRIWDIEKE